MGRHPTCIFVECMLSQVSPHGLFSRFDPELTEAVQQEHWHLWDLTGPMKGLINHSVPSARSNIPTHAILDSGTGLS